MPRKRYLTLEKAVQRFFEDDEQSDIDIVVVPPETAEASDEEEGNDNILNHANDDLPCDRHCGSEQDRTPATTKNEDRYLALTARRNGSMNATLLQQLLRRATGTRVSTQTARNRLYPVGFLCPVLARRPCFP
ncbi:hypothetical protein AVEN_75290-1 [Araneus ventricosus]|uniref:Transposase Tc1-like domain-containing protein n=1 Tax=Araneus ventricosus TaxID=182803 RepID=A0A4Y2S015_ARAVE|nr:hypothetical protein AVEN_75290-1 [Araneus ventricosus]